VRFLNSARPTLDGSVLRGSNLLTGPLREVGLRTDISPLSVSDELFYRHGARLRQLLTRRLRARSTDINGLIRNKYLIDARRPELGGTYSRLSLGFAALPQTTQSRCRQAIVR